MKIPYVNLNIQWKKEKRNLIKIIDKTLGSDGWVGGTNIDKFEKNIAKFSDVLICFVDDGSTDQTKNIICELIKNNSVYLKLS